MKRRGKGGVEIFPKKGTRARKWKKGKGTSLGGRGGGKGQRDKKNVFLSKKEGGGKENEKRSNAFLDAEGTKSNRAKLEQLQRNVKGFGRRGKEARRRSSLAHAGRSEFARGTRVRGKGVEKGGGGDAEKGCKKENAQYIKIKRENTTT